jgi:protoheme IX farnesyltransferase
VTPTAAATEAGALSASLRTARHLVEVTRPRILLVVVATALPIVAAASTLPPVGRLLGTLAALALTGAGCSALNAWLERDTDPLMTRTAVRPLATGALSPATVLSFGIVTSIAAIVVFHLLGGFLASGVALATFAIYVLVYTAWLKRRTPLNIVIGGASGAAAPLLADASLNGELGALAWMLFLIIFLWTPPHFWAIAIYRRDEYGAARIPMLPNVAGDAIARRDGLVYFGLFAPATLTPLALPTLGWAYAVAAVALNAWFLAALLKARRADDPQVDYRAFRVSVRMIGLLVLALSADLALI